MPQPERPPKTVPKTPKPFFRKQETRKKEHAARPIAPKTVPKTPKPFFRKQETRKKGHAAPGKPPFWH
jgi:hypothetical protein